MRHSVDMVALNGRAGAVAGTFTPDDTQRGSFVSVVTLADDGRIASYAAYVSVPAVGISAGR